MPSQNHRQKISEELLLNGLLINDTEDLPTTNYKMYEHNDRLNLDAITVACLYAENKQIPVILGDLPELVWRQNIVNSLTLLQLQNIFTHCSRELALHPDIEPRTPLAVAYLLYPEIFVKPTDEYMATLFEYMIHKGHKDIVALVGYNQSESIKEYLDKRRVSNLEQELKVKDVLKSIIRDVQGEELLDKHTVLDVMYHGRDILKKMKDINFKTSYKMIQKYSDPDHVDSSSLDKFRIMHYQFLVKYQNFCEQEYEKGKKTLERSFLSKVIV